jgi:1-acyl-sn-glycerol-3-phosphate acyltransferase
MMRLLGRFLLPLLARVEVQGLERFPRKGPVIVVGNHTGALEVVLLTVFAPRIVEYLGSVDIPHEGYIASFVYTYGFIPIFRGKASRRAMEAGLDVLRQDAVLGLFPEGGIWEPAIRRAQAGVAWLSYRGLAPILPIGFGSTRGALVEMLRLKRPRLTMRVGDLVPPLLVTKEIPRKQQFQDAADNIVNRIWELVPEEEQLEPIPIRDETFDFVVECYDSGGAVVQIPESYKLENGPALSKVLHRPTLFNNFLQNLQLPVAPLKQLHERPALDVLLLATRAVVDYLDSDNPYYFTYRYGHAEGTAMGDGFQEFHDLLSWANSKGYEVRGVPIRRYHRTDTGESITLERPQEEDKW